MTEHYASETCAENCAVLPEFPCGSEVGQMRNEIAADAAVKSSGAALG